MAPTLNHWVSQQHNLCSYTKITSWSWSSLQYLPKYYNPMTLNCSQSWCSQYCIFTHEWAQCKWVCLINTFKTKQNKKSNNNKLKPARVWSSVRYPDFTSVGASECFKFWSHPAFTRSHQPLKHRSRFRYHEICLFWFFIVDLASRCCFMWCVFISGALHPKKFPRAGS